MHTHTFPKAIEFSVIPKQAATGARASFLMCPPKLYDVQYVINPWMEGNIHASSRERAARQWQALYEAVCRVADVSLVEPVAGSPDMVFTANAGLAKDGTVAISSFMHRERQGEEAHFRRWFQRAGYSVVDTPRATPFEGEGDALFSADGDMLWVGFGTRTLSNSHDALRKLFRVPVTGLHLVDPRFYHLDTCFAPLDNGDLLYYPAAFDEAANRRIEQYYKPEQRIAIHEEDAVRFACNAVNVGRAIIMNRISTQLCVELVRRGFEVTQVELDEFLKAGGAAKCLVMKLTPGTETRTRQVPAA